MAQGKYKLSVCLCFLTFITVLNQGKAEELDSLFVTTLFLFVSNHMVFPYENCTNSLIRIKPNNYTVYSLMSDSMDCIVKKNYKYLFNYKLGFHTFLIMINN